MLIPTALLSFGLSFFLTPKLITLAIRKKWYDLPSPRRVHKSPLPRIGGLAMFAGFTVAVGASLLINFIDPHFWQLDDMWRILLTLLGATLVTGVMFYDDLYYLRPLPKLVTQIVAALLVILPHFLNSSPATTLISEIKNPFSGDKILFDPLFAVFFTVFWIVGMMNTVNVTDGLDGLAGGVVCISALVLFVENVYSQRNNPFQFTSSLLALTLAAAILGFLPFNWHPSKIIMGDCGAMFLGYILAIISIIDGAKLAAMLLLIGFPVLDYAWVIFLRLYRKRKPTNADRTHLHHRLLDMGYSQRQIVLFFYLITLIFGVVGILIPQQPGAKLIALVALGLLLLPVLFYSMRRAGRKSFDLPPSNEEREKLETKN
ncbi:MAG: undecaprenyl/decaprenyl-phosphate alpha-N-acetylglucosaminyl 1-phosphate transferase [Chloroflexi bacterium]|nr:undecaprenyl/decaprenyl-phosphate alpha-N-acetylglucosaminyl 1-phosphate transferase [Chloroflexota bacterium]